MSTAKAHDTKLLYRDEYFIQDKDTDVFGSLRPASVALIMQDLAELHASSYGNSRDDLLKTNAVWVLARTKASFSKLSGPRERLELLTWPGRMVRSIFPRYYSFKLDGETIGSAVTLWMLVDSIKHEPADPAAHNVYITGDPTIPPPLGNPVRLREKGEPLYSVTRRCSYSDLDYNRHMNNARYVEWLCDTVNPSSTPKGFQVNFLSEVRNGEEISLNVYQDALVVGINANGVRAFEGKLEF